MADPRHVRAQFGLDAIHVQAPDVIHVHMRNHDVGDRSQASTVARLVQPSLQPIVGSGGERQ
jgi:hypothetical protein